MSSRLTRVPGPIAAVLVLFLLLGGCASAPRRPPAAPEGHRPILLVHGIDEHPASFEPLVRRLRDAGWRPEELEAARLVPNNGQLPVETLAVQVARAAERLRRRTGAERIDVVAFSLGALVTRYWVQELGGQARVRRFISVSGPHHGTWTAYAFREPAVLQMRPESALLRKLESNPDPFGDTEVFSFWTPLDTVILPAESSRLPGATERTFSVPLHFMMLGDPGVLSALVDTLSAPPAARAASVDAP